MADRQLLLVQAPIRTSPSRRACPTRRCAVGEWERYRRHYLGADGASAPRAGPRVAAGEGSIGDGGGGGGFEWSLSQVRPGGRSLNHNCCAAVPAMAIGSGGLAGVDAAVSPGGMRGEARKDRFKVAGGGDTPRLTAAALAGDGCPFARMSRTTGKCEFVALLARWARGGGVLESHQ